MPALRKYDEETQARAVRMYLDRVAEGDIAKRGAREEVGALLGINESTPVSYTHLTLPTNREV